MNGKSLFPTVILTLAGWRQKRWRRGRRFEKDREACGLYNNNKAAALRIETWGDCLIKWWELLVTKLKCAGGRRMKWNDGILSFQRMSSCGIWHGWVGKDNSCKRTIRSVRGVVSNSKMGGGRRWPTFEWSMVKFRFPRLNSNSDRHGPRHFMSQSHNILKHFITYVYRRCKEPGRYLTTLQPTSVVICFHNEAWSVLLRTG